MPFPDPIFPGEIWDGLTENRNRLTPDSRVRANADDYDRLASEMISVQEVVDALSPGGGGNPVTEVSTNTTITTDVETILFVDASGGNIVITLPDVSAFTNKIWVKKIDATGNTVTVQGAQTIDGQPNQIITAQYTTITIVSSSTEWGII